MNTIDPRSQNEAAKKRDEPLKDGDDLPVAGARSDATKEEIDQLREKQGDYEEVEELPLKEQG